MDKKTAKAEALLRLNGIPVIDRTPLDNAVLFSRHGEVGQAAIELLEMRAKLERLEAIEEAGYRLAEHPDSQAKLAALLRLVGVEL
jgi:hypothetical protein